MNLRKMLSFGFVALAAAVVITATPANAQQLYKATFEQPFEAKWGNTILEPGQYTIAVEQSAGQKLVRLHGPSTYNFLIGPSNPERVSENGRLTFVSINGVMTVTKLDAGEIGQSFDFPVHKIKGERAARTNVEPEPATLVVATR